MPTPSGPLHDPSGPMPPDFRTLLVDHLDNPRSPGLLDDPDGAAEVENPACGDVLVLHLRADDERVRRVGWRCDGCAASMAAASALAVLLEGETLEEAEAVDAARVGDALGGLPPISRHAGVLAADAAAAALRDLRERRDRT